MPQAYEPMTLYISETSPFARAARVMVREKGLVDRITEMPVDPFSRPDALLAANPLGQIPTLVLPDGRPVFDSPVIVDFLDTLGEPALIPRSGDAGLYAARLRAINQGVLEASVRTVLEMRRPEGEQSPHWIGHWRAAITRACDVLENECAFFEDSRAFPALLVGVTLSYLDFRRPEIAWRDGRPRLSTFIDEISARPSLRDTRPPSA